MRSFVCVMLLACGGHIAGAPANIALDAVCDGPAISGESVFDDITNWPALPGYSAQQGIRFAGETTSSALHVEISASDDGSATCSAMEVTVPVHVWMWSADGRLNDRFDATVARADKDADVELRRTLSIAELAGSLRAEVAASSIELRLAFHRTDGFVEMFGAIYAGGEQIANVE